VEIHRPAFGDEAVEVEVVIDGGYGARMGEIIILPIAWRGSGKLDGPSTMDVIGYACGAPKKLTSSAHEWTDCIC
jgi:hypothetical protein